MRKILAFSMLFNVFYQGLELAEIVLWIITKNYVVYLAEKGVAKLLLCDWYKVARIDR